MVTYVVCIIENFKIIVSLTNASLVLRGIFDRERERYVIERLDAVTVVLF